MKILELDIETAPNQVYAWGLRRQDIAINQIVEVGYTMCWSAKWHGKSGIMFDSIKVSDTKTMLEGIHELMDEADCIVHYNGNKFDIPTLNWEFAKYDMEPPSVASQIDLYRTVSSRFRMPSYKLDFVCQELGLGGKIQHKGMELWKECMAGNENAWRTMKRYNKQDVALLEKLYDHLRPWINNHPNYGLYTTETRPVCTNCGSTHVVKKGTQANATQIYDRYKCVDCGTPLRGRFTVLDPARRQAILTQGK